MMVGAEFPGDSNEVLMDVQHALYGEMVVRLFTAPRDRYLVAAALLRVENDFSDRLRSMKGFDHRTLQGAHDVIATFFRFSRDDGGQLQLGETDSEYLERWKSAWREFFQLEVSSLVGDDEFVRAICNAAVYANEESGTAAERWLDRFLRDRYRLAP
jgi:hypothetical protein